jgi:hypothetical protein
MNCLAEDLAGYNENFPYPADLDNPTPEEDAAIKEWWKDIDAKQGQCPENPDGIDPYTIEPEKASQ